MSNTVKIEKKNRSLNMQVLLIATPLVLQNMAQTFLGVVDTWFVSDIGTEAIAALGLAGVISYTFFVLFRNSIGSLVAFFGRAHGANDDLKIGDIVWRGLCAAGLLSTTVVILPWLFTLLMGWATPADAPSVRDFGITYLRIRALEVPFILFSAVGWAFMVGRGDSRTPMLLMWSMVALNIFLDWLLVPGNLGFPAMGVAGAAWATVIANLFNAIVSGLILWSPKNRGLYNTGNPRLVPWVDIKKVFEVGLPAGFGDFIEIASFTLFFAMIARLGTNVLAANQIAVQYMSISFTFGLAISMAASSLVSQFIGAGDVATAEKAAYRSLAIGMIGMGLIGATYIISPAFLISIFSDEPAVIEAGVSILRVIAIYQIFDAAGIVLSGALMGGGDTRFTMFTRLVLAWGLFLPMAWVALFWWDLGIAGAWATALIYLAMLAAVYFWRFRGGKWKTIQLA
ncbi:MAG: MATE family multidrug resistance protein [Cellvibrionaceae bacterium]|jgi:MATE family multidrug resistance protein